jgi:hypothetical protein
LGAFAGSGFGPGVNRPVKAAGGFNAKQGGPGGRVVFQTQTVFAARVVRAVFRKDAPIVVVYSPAEAYSDGFAHIRSPASARLEQRFIARKLYSPGLLAALKIRRIRQLVEIWHAWQAKREND